MLTGGRKPLLMIHPPQFRIWGFFPDIMAVASFAFYFAVFSGSWLFFFPGKNSEFRGSMDCKKHLRNQLPLSVALGGALQCEPIWGLECNLVHKCGLASNPGWQPLICRLAFAGGKYERIISNLPLLLAIIAQTHVLLVSFKKYYL